MRLRLIHDGMWLDGRAEVPGGPALTFQYRPATSAEVAQYDADRNRQKVGPDQDAVRARFLAARILKWDLEAADGTTAAVSVESVRAIPPGYVERIDSLVCGYTRTPAAEDDAKKSPSPPA